MALEVVQTRYPYNIPVSNGNINYGTVYGIPIRSTDPSQKVVQKEDIKAWAYRVEANLTQTAIPLVLETDYTVTITDDGANILLVDEPTNTLGVLADKTNLQLILINLSLIHI